MDYLLSPKVSYVTFPTPSIEVVKRTGVREPFIPEKIVVSCLKTGAPLETSRIIAAKVALKLTEERRTEVSTVELARMVLEFLKQEKEEYYQNWLVYDRAVKRRKTEEEIKAR